VASIPFKTLPQAHCYPTQRTRSSHNIPSGATPRDPRRPAVYVASNKGLLLRISCQTDQIICAYQLHTCAIRTLSIYSG
jgi:hypothetical protein